MRKINIIWLFALAAACSSSPTAPSAVGSTGGDGSARVGLLGAPPVSTITPGTGVGTNPPLGAPNSCPTNQPAVAVNGNNGKHDFSILTPVAGYTYAYGWELQRRNGANVYVAVAGPAPSQVTDGRGGLYAQPPTLKAGSYRVRAQALRRGCGGLDQGTWGEWVPFSVEGPMDNPETPPPTPPVCVYLGYGQFGPPGCVWKDEE